MEELIRIGAIILKDRKLLLIREKSQSFFTLPGAAPEGNESFEGTLLRGIKETLNTGPKKMKFFNTFFGESPASNSLLILETYLVVPNGDLGMGPKMEEMKWVDSRDMSSVPVNFLIKDQIVPELKRLKALE